MLNEHSNRLAALRTALARAGLDGFIVPRSDEYLGEYVPECSERLAWLTGFTGSAGLALVLANRAAVFSDGRYTLQLAQQTDPTLWEQLHITETKPEDWLRIAAPGARIGYDPWLLSADALRRFTGVELAPIPNPIDEIWPNRPAPPNGPAVAHPEAFAGEPSATKRTRLAATLAADGIDAALLTDPASVNWLFNIRGTDLEFCPFALAYALLYADGTATLFLEPARAPELDVTIKSRTALEADIAALKGKTIRYDPATQPVWFEQALTAAGAIIAPGPDPILLPKSRKNPTEQNGTRAAHLRDGIAVVRFLAWLATATAQTEISAAEKLLEFRAGAKYFRGESFPAISGAGENGAIIHYRATPQSNRKLHPNEVYLIDSGGQYLDATTDITRTLWTGPDDAPAEVKAHVTSVLSGHIALAQAVFPQGVAGPHLDVLARTALWQSGLDYDHGTGHGVGSYLSVHEGPAGISRAARPVPLEEGMILSNEPGYYLPGAYGIRLENLLLVQHADFAEAKKPFLRFETLTLVPFDTALIEPTHLTQAARDWLNAYHAHVFATLAPALDTPTKTWLQSATAAI